MFIPVYPRGRPRDGGLREILEEALVKANVDVQRSIEPPMSAFELQSGADRPSDDVILERFVAYAHRAYRNVTDTPLPILPWRPRADHALRSALTFLTGQLPFLSNDRMAKHILLIEDAGAAIDFEQCRQRDGALLGALHQGGLWCTDYGQFFFITWSPTVTRADLGKRLESFLLSGRSFFTGQEQDSPFPPPPPIPAIQMPRRRPSSMTMRAVTETAPPVMGDCASGQSKRRP